MHVSPPGSPEESLSSSEDELLNVPAAQIQAEADSVRDEKSPDTKALMGNMKANVFSRIRAVQLIHNPNNLELRIASYKANMRQAEKYKALYGELRFQYKAIEKNKRYLLYLSTSG